ncbi:MAG TPA: dockerin type I domain-containing protein, partial [Armatimonadota bacterium]|nr:dockerin type I domain-containing protein [Armatimonadota bacterium]
MNKRTLPRLETTRRAVVLIAVLGLLAAVSLASLPSAPRVNDPYGDVNGDGLVNSADINLLRTYLTNPSVLSTERKDRIRRFGDINNIVNRTTIGNGILDSHDVVRHALMAGGIIDAGTAGVARADYGDVDGDGKVTLVDTVIIQRSLSGFKNPAYETKVRSKGLGDISPTIPYVSFGDKAITDADFQQLQARAAGSEPNPPAYVDYWPAQCPNIEFTGVVADRYTFTDLNGNGAWDASCLVG